MIDAERERIAREYTRRVWRVALSIWRRCHPGDMEIPVVGTGFDHPAADVFQGGMLGLTFALNRYKSGPKPFGDYARWWIVSMAWKAMKRSKMFGFKESAFEEASPDDVRLPDKHDDVAVVDAKIDIGGVKKVLSPVELLVIDLRFGQGKTLQETADEIGIGSRQAADWHEKRAFKKLRGGLET